MQMGTDQPITLDVSYTRSDFAADQTHTSWTEFLPGRTLISKKAKKLDSERLSSKISEGRIRSPKARTSYSKLSNWRDHLRCTK